MAGMIAIVVGRVFGVIELFIIGSAFVAAVVLAIVFVRVRRPNISASRWVHPTVLVAGDTGRVDLRLEHHGRVRSTGFELAERVSRANATDHVARLSIAPLSRGTRSSAGYQLPTTARGIVRLGPLVVETRDPLGIARSTRTIADIDTVTVAPKTFLLDMPVLGQGALGRQLVVQARRLGPGLVHSAEQAGLTARFVTAGGIDLRGPETGANTLRVLARIEPDGSKLGLLDRDPGEGLGLMILVTGSHRSQGWSAIQAIVDPTLTVIGVTTDERSKANIGVSCRTEDEFVDSWRGLNGTSSTRPVGMPAGVRR